MKIAGFHPTGNAARRRQKRNAAALNAWVSGIALYPADRIIIRSKLLRVGRTTFEPLPGCLFSALANCFGLRRAAGLISALAVGLVSASLMVCPHGHLNLQILSAKASSETK